MSDYGEYDGDTIHDMWVYSTYEICTDEDESGDDYQVCAAPSSSATFQRAAVKPSLRKQLVRQMDCIRRHRKSLQADEEHLARIEHNILYSTMSMESYRCLVILQEKYVKEIERHRAEILEMVADAKMMRFKIAAYKQLGINLAVGVGCLVAIMIACLY